MKARFSLVAAVATALVMGVAMAASASAAEFEAGKTGALESHGGVWNTSTKTYGGEEAEEQVFTVEYETSKRMDVECTKVTDKGEVTTTLATTQDVAVEYSGCEIAGTKAKNIDAEYEFNAGSDTSSPWEGSVSIIEHPIKVEATNGTCAITVPEQSQLKTIKYVEITGPEGNVSLEFDANVSGIEWSATGTLASCNGTGSKVGTGKAGVYTGNSTSWLVGSEFRMAKGGRPELRTTRIAGKGTLVTECRFAETSETCIVRIEAFATGGNPLKITAEKIIAVGILPFTFVIPGKKLPEQECKLGMKLSLNESCADEIEYTGKAKPALNEYKATFEAEAEEEVTKITTPVATINLFAS